MLDDYRPPTWKDRLLHPLSIAAILVVGWLRVVCPEERRVACQARQASFAVVVKQSNPRGQAGANAMAVSDTAERELWRAVEQALQGGRAGAHRGAGEVRS